MVFCECDHLCSTESASAPGQWDESGDGNKTVKMTRAQQQALHEKRLTRILDVAVAGGNEVVILGAFDAELLRMIRRLWQLRFPM